MQIADIQDKALQSGLFENRKKGVLTNLLNFYKADKIGMQQRVAICFSASVCAL